MRVFRLLVSCSIFAFVCEEKVAAVSSIYTNKADFDAAVAGAFESYTETFSLLSSGDLTSPQNFSGGAFSFSALAPEAGLYAVDGTDSKWLLAAAAASSLTFSFTSGNVTAVGGNFFLIDGPNSPVSGNLTLQLSDLTTTNVTVSSSSDYFGFLSETPIFSLAVTGQTAGAYSTAANLTVANTVPEPSTSALLLAGLGVLGLLVRCRKA